MDDVYVSDVTIKATTRCHKEFSCLCGSRKDLCPVDYYISDGLTFVTCVGDTNCDYRTPYGDSVICLCPVRIELYNKYSI